MKRTKTDNAIGPAWSKWRRDHLMTQPDLARILNVSRVHLSRVENGHYIPGFALRGRMKALMKQHEKEKQNADNRRTD